MRALTAAIVALVIAISVLRLTAQAPPEWEVRFRQIPEAGNIGEYLRTLSARPHHLGSPYGKENAEWMRAQFTEWGWDARIESYDVLFPTPKERLVELVAPTRFKALLEEPAVAGDPTSGAEGRAAPDLQRLLDRRRRHRRRSSTSTTGGPSTTRSSSGAASPSRARSSSPATAARGAASSRRWRPSTARSAA